MKRVILKRMKKNLTLLSVVMIHYSHGRYQYMDSVNWNCRMDWWNGKWPRYNKIRLFFNKKPFHDFRIKDCMADDGLLILSYYN